MKILKFIKKINPSIQIIMFSASNDSSILDNIHDEGILGYLKKDAPSDKYTSSNDGFAKLGSLIERGIERKYLQEIYSTSNELLGILINNPFSQYKSEKYKLYSSKYYIDLLTGNSHYIFTILDTNLKNRFNYAMVSIATSIEALLSIFIKEMEFCNKYWDNEDCFEKSVGGKIEHLIEKKLKQKKDFKFQTLITRRNDYLHSNTKSKTTTKEEIIEWFQLLLDAIRTIDNVSTYIPYVKAEKRETIFTNSGIRKKI